MISPLGSPRFVSQNGTINLPKVLNYKHKLAKNRKLLKLPKALSSLMLSSIRIWIYLTIADFTTPVIDKFCLWLG
jgi:hypothetical protein